MADTFRALAWDDDGPAVVLIDQTQLPDAEVELRCTDLPALLIAIRDLSVRGAPLLGIAGAYGVALGAALGYDVESVADSLRTARPTAVNLGRGVDLALTAFRASGGDQAAALAAAHDLQAAEDRASEAMAAAGMDLVPPNARILTHCNTGALACGGSGSAFAVALAAHRAGRLQALWIDETRPLLQGARLTAWEARRNGMPHSVLADSAAAALIASGRVDLVLVGADRIAADGSVANKIGTYALALAAARHGVPFVVVAPTSTIDLDTPDGASIVVEPRGAEEVTFMRGLPIAPLGTAAWNPAFDVTPPDLVTALVTERGVVRPVEYSTLRRILT